MQLHLPAPPPAGVAEPPAIKMEAAETENRESTGADGDAASEEVAMTDASSGESVAAPPAQQKQAGDSRPAAQQADEQQQLCTQQADADVEMSVAEGSGGQSATDTPTADAAEPKTEQQSEANMPECGTP